MRSRAQTYGFTAILLALALLTPFIGVSWIGLSSLWHPGDLGYAIFWEMRVPRVIAAFMVGVALSISGLGLQVLFRNDLTSPFTLGVSSASSLGVVVAMLGSGSTSIALTSSFGVTSSALLGSLLAALVLILVTYTSIKGAQLLLTGLALNFFLANLAIGFQYFTDVGGIFRVYRWMMGSFEGVGQLGLLGLSLTVALGVGVIWWKGPELDLISIGDDYAVSKGVSLKGGHQVVIAVVSVMTGVAVAFCGPIGFVGVIIPNLVKQLAGASVRVRVPFVALVGGSFLAVCDALCRSLMPPYELPVGIVTALVGVPVFLWILLRVD